MRISSPTYGIIPARYDSRRFPGKPLVDLLGKPMIWHVYQRARRCPELNHLLLATDDERIQRAADEAGIPVMMTRADHTSGTDRVLETAKQLRLQPEAVVVNIQGDEPCLDPSMITALIRPFSNPEVRVTTLARRMDRHEAQSPDRVKVVFTPAGKALYFSRSPIPYDRNESDPITSSHWLHIGLYAFRMQTLERFAALPPGTLEKREGLEQLRLLENGIPIQVVETTHVCHGVDSPEDLQTAIDFLQQEMESAQVR